MISHPASTPSTVSEIGGAPLGTSEAYSSLNVRADEMSAASRTHPLQQVAIFQRSTSHAYANRIRRQRLTQIARASSTDELNLIAPRREKRVAAYLRDRRVIESAVYNALPNCSRDAAQAIAAQIDLFAECSEPVEWFPKPKPRGGYRPICKFGVMQSIRHRLIADVLDAQLPNNNRFFDIRGKGAGRAVTAIAQSIEPIGPYVLCADIVSCFQSVNFDAVYGLDLIPNEVIRHALDYRHLPLQRRLTSDNHLTTIDSYDDGDSTSPDDKNDIHSGSNAASPKGLLHGSPASNALLRHLLFTSTSGMPAGAEIFVYTDNFYVVARSEEVCSQIRESLTRHLASCPAGPLQFNPTTIRHIANGVDVLGYCLSRPEATSAVRRELADRNLAKLMEMLMDCPSDCSNPLAVDLATRELDQYLASFPALDEASLAEIRQHLMSYDLQ